MSGHLDSLLPDLAVILGEDGVRSDIDARKLYGRDETEDLCFLPHSVLLPRSTQQVAKVLSLATAHRIAVTPRGGGTGLSGGALPVQGGWLLSLERLDRIRRIDQRNLLAEVESGVVTGSLQRQLEASGLFYPPDPASHERCMIGGNVAEDSAGPRSCKYGSTRRWVMGLEAVLADGTVLVTGSDNRKDVAGYDLTQLLVGSEGSLAVVTAATLRLLPLPPARLTIALPFGDLETAATAVSEIFRRGYDPAACEILERRALSAVGKLEPLPLALQHLEALLLLELDGFDADSLLDAASRLAGDLAADLARDPLVALDASDQRRLWRLRDRVGEAVKNLSPYKEADAVVPRSALAELVLAARHAAREQGLEAICYGHAGDGNLHVNLLKGGLSDVDWIERRDAAEEALFTAVIGLGGSISGEHGIGWTQRKFLPLMRSESFLEIMRRLKNAFDPLGILNPGKIFLDEHG